MNARHFGKILAVVLLLSPTWGSAQVLDKILPAPLQGPDLQVVNVALDTDCAIVLTLRNNGPGIVPDTAYSGTAPVTGVQIWKDGAPFAGSSLFFFDRHKQTQPVGGTVTSSYYSTHFLPLGSQVIQIDVDSGHSVAESNELNNSLTKTLTCPKGPDLVPTKISLQPIGISPSSPCQIFLTVQNIGTGKVPFSAYGYGSPSSSVEVTKDGALWGLSVLKDFDPTRLVQPAGGAITAPWFPLNANLRVAPGEHTLRVVLDSNNIAVESNETNNSITQKVMCGIVVAPPTTNAP